jgi:hypothetical protein
MGAAADLRGRMRESWKRLRDGVDDADLECATASGWIQRTSQQPADSSLRLAASRILA